MPFYYFYLHINYLLPGMISQNHLETEHKQQVESLEEQIRYFKKRLRNIYITRIFTFLSLCFAFIALWGHLPWIITALSATVIIFLVLLRKELKWVAKKKFHEKLQAIHFHELRLLMRDLDGLPEGLSFLEKQHPYARDLDIFGSRSIFQLLNRTCTYSGAKVLGNTLNSPPLSPQYIKERQTAIQELANQEKWCHHFLAYGKADNEEEDTAADILQWLESPDRLQGTFVRIMKYTGPIVCILVTLLASFSIIAWSWWVTVFIGQLLVTAAYTKRINRIHDTLSKKYTLIDNYTALIQSIEQISFQSTLLQTLQEKVKNSNTHQPATLLLKQLKSSLDRLDSRLNIMIAIVLNGVFLWDLNNAHQIEKWRAQNKHHFRDWLEAISDLDALISLALFARSHPHYTYPTITEADFSLHAEQMGHPLVDEKKLVKNDYQLEGKSHVDILTGANMAGKSTFLRTVGVNILLACLGVPVCASSFRIRPVKLFTSLRTIDSLQDNESFFYAELKRLEALLDLYKNGDEIFFLLDEILKGTNSKDQHTGSVGLIKKILSLQGMGIIATHDLGLATLQDELPSSVRNLCFEISIINNELHFDYTLKAGFCQTMNASFLMRKMELI